MKWEDFALQSTRLIFSILFSLFSPAVALLSHPNHPGVNRKRFAGISAALSVFTTNIFVAPSELCFRSTFISYCFQGHIAFIGALISLKANIATAALVQSIKILIMRFLQMSEYLVIRSFCFHDLIYFVVADWHFASLCVNFLWGNT